MNEETISELVFAISSNDFHALEKIIYQAGELRVNCQMEALRWALLAENNEAIKWLYDHGVNVAMPFDDGQVPLHIAINSGNIELVRCLIDCGADLGAINSIGQTALMIASKVGFVDCVIFLLNKRVDVNKVDLNKRNALHWALTGAASLDVCRLLVGSGCDVNQKSVSNDSPLDYCLKSGGKCLDIFVDVKGERLAK